MKALTWEETLAVMNLVVHLAPLGWIIARAGDTMVFFPPGVSSIQGAVVFHNQDELMRFVRNIQAEAPMPRQVVE